MISNEIEDDLSGNETPSDEFMSERASKKAKKSLLPRPSNILKTGEQDSEVSQNVSLGLGVAKQTILTKASHSKTPGHSKTTPTTKKRKLLTEFNASTFNMVSQNQIERIEKNLEASKNLPPKFDVLRREQRDSANVPQTQMEIECLARQKATPTANTEYQTSRQRLDQIAFQLRISSLWEQDGPVSRYKCFWPCYNAIEHDASLVRIDFFIDYLYNMFFIAHKGTTIERKQLLINYDTNVAEHMQQNEMEESQALSDFEINPEEIPCVSNAYRFDERMFGLPNERNSIRSEVARSTTNIQDIIMRKNYLSSKRKHSDDHTTNSQESENSDTNDEDIEKNNNFADMNHTSLDISTMTLQQAAKICKISAAVYEHLYMTKYEMEVPHSMTSLQQRLFIGRLNRIEFLYTREHIKTTPAYIAATKAFGLEDFNQPSGWSSIYIIELGKTMQKYVMGLFSRIREKSKFEFPFVYGDVHAKNLHAFYNGKLRKLNYQIEHFVKLLCSNCLLFQQETTPAIPEHPSILTQAILGPHLCDEEVYAKANSYQKMLLSLHFKCQELRLRKCKGIAYQEVITKEGYRTNSFREYSTIEMLCNQAPNLVTQGDKWLTSTERAGLQSMCTTYMRETDTEYFFPWLKRQQYVWSFQNGIYDGQQDRFWRYDSDEIRSDPQSPYNRKEASAKYIDKQFDLELMRPEAMKDPSLIKVDAVDVIFDTQRFSKPVREWTWGFMGRLYFPQRMLDNWQVVLWFKGVSGTGKSTLIHAISAAYESRDVGVMANNIESQFGLMNFADLFLLIAPEVKVTFSLDSAVFQTMASADEMSIARKNLDPLSLPAWKVPSIYGSNVYPRWVDASGSIQRRIMALLFPVAVPKQVNNLDGCFLKQIDALIVRACRSYKQKISIVGTDNVWDHVPQDFLVARREVGRQTTELVRFLDEYLVLSGAPSDEEKTLDFVDVAELERLFMSRRQTGAERNMRFSDQLEMEIGSFHSLCISFVGAAKTPIIRGVRLNLKRVQDVRCDPTWMPAKSHFYTEAEVLAIEAKKNKFIENEIS